MYKLVGWESGVKASMSGVVVSVLKVVVNDEEKCHVVGIAVPDSVSLSVGR